MESMEWQILQEVIHLQVDSLDEVRSSGRTSECNKIDPTVEYRQLTGSSVLRITQSLDDHCRFEDVIWAATKTFDEPVERLAQVMEVCEKTGCGITVSGPRTDWHRQMKEEGHQNA